MQILNSTTSIISDLCKLCTWNNQCGGKEPCSHFEPQDIESWTTKEYLTSLHKRQQLSIGMSIEQGNYTEQE